jgi:diguanylate cyclase (GGDEF)-like protein/PAS domain S-box-containing protein
MRFAPRRTIFGHDTHGSFAGPSKLAQPERAPATDEVLLSARVFENSVEGIMITDERGDLVRVNRAFERITGYAESEVIGLNPRFLASGQHTSVFFEAFWEDLSTKGSWQGEIWNRRKSGEVYPQWLSVSAVRDGRGKTQHFIGLFSDISDKKALEERLHHQAHHDALTDLPNRTLLLDRLEQSLARAAREGRQVALFFLDLDRFKSINDSLGHSVGDLLLKETARRLRAALRASDTVARLGGDEFTIVLQDLEGDALPELTLVARKIQDALSAPFLLQGYEVSVSASLGAAVYPRDGLSRDDLLRNADSAMYHAKARGRNNFQFYSRELNEAALERFRLEGGLRRAIERNQLSLLFQPQVAIGSGRTVGCEVLLRWKDDDLGAIPPGRFIPIAEDTGLIHSIGRWVLQAACARGRAWRAAGHPELRIAVNLSAHQFHHPQLIEDVRAILADTGLDPSALELEITEGVLLRDLERTTATLRGLSEMGLLLTIDDFGTGYSSLSYLKRFPIDRVKIDRSFVSDIGQDDDSSAIVWGIINLARGLSLEVTAEGVERPEQVEFLREYGCDAAQGFYFSRPLDAAEFERWLSGPSSSFAAAAGAD